VGSLFNIGERADGVRSGQAGDHLFGSLFAILAVSRKGVALREFGYLSSSARTRITSAVTNRQSMAMVIATRIQDDFSSNRPHLLRVSTARSRLRRPADRRPNLPGRFFRRRSHTRKRSADSLQLGFHSTCALLHMRIKHARDLRWTFLLMPGITLPPATPPRGYSWA